MENKNIQYQKEEINPNNYMIQNKIITGNTITEHQTTESNSFIIPDSILKKKRIHYDIMSLSSNRNSNLDDINNFSNNINISSNNLSKDKENSKINELINKFNSIYNSYNDNNDLNNNYYTKEKKDNYDNSKNKYSKDHHLSYDNIYSNKSNYINSNKNKQKKSGIDKQNNKKQLFNYKNNIRLKNYTINKNKKYRTYRDSQEKKIMNKRYQNQNQNNSQELSTISIKSNIIINKYNKKILEDEKIDNEPNLKYSAKSYTGFGVIDNKVLNTNEIMNYNRLKEYSNDNIFNSYLNTNNSNNNKSEIIKNPKLLKNSDIYLSDLSDEKRINIYIKEFEELKYNLNNAIQNNKILKNNFYKVQNENKVLDQKILEVITKYKSIKSENEKKEKENIELKCELDNKKKEIYEKNKNIQNLEKEIIYLKKIINNNNKSQIDFSNKIKESNKDNDHLIGELNNTIDNLQKINLDNNNEIIKLKNKIEDLKKNNNSKENEISILNENINKSNLLINNKDNTIKELNNLINEIKNKNEKSKKEINDVNIENEKLKNEVKSIKLLLTDREHTISAQKNTISFLTETFNKNMNIINENMNKAIINSENENEDKEFKTIVEKMKKEIFTLNKKNNIKEKERMKLEKDINEFQEQYEQIKYEYQLLYQKYKEQNKIIEVIKKESLKRNNENELQHLTKVNFDILGKLKRTENDNILKTQQLEQLKKNYELINNQFNEFKNNNNISNSLSESNTKDKDIYNTNKKYIINRDINRYTQNNIIKEQDNLLNVFKKKNNDIDVNHYNNNVDNLDNSLKKMKEESVQISNDNLISINNNNIYNSHKKPEKEKAILLSDFDFPINNNDYKYYTLPLQKELNYNNDNDKNNQIKKLEDLSAKNNKIKINFLDNYLDNDQYSFGYTNIYNLKGNKIISFDLFKKKFTLIYPKDKTNGVFNELISKKISPITLNTPYGFFILIDNYIFCYNTINNTINILTKLLFSHKNGGFINVNNEIYSISGKDCLQCEKYSNKNNKNIKLPNVNFDRINSGICNINNEFLYVFFGNKCYNSFERLKININYESMNENINNWEYIQIKSINENKISLENFSLFLDDFNNIIILGGNDSKGNYNKDIYKLNLVNNTINVIGKIDGMALYMGQSIQLGDSIFVIYDSNNGLHFFNKELDYHEIYNFNL